MAGIGSGHIKVTTEELQNKASAAESSIKTMKSNLQEIKSILESTNGYWVGEAGDLYRKTYAATDEVLQNIITELEKYPPSLMEIAGVAYAPAEAENISTASELSSGVI